MKSRVFIVINFPEEIKNKLLEYPQKWPELPARWLKKDNLHITLVFLGYIRDEELIEVSRAIKETASQNSPFLINLTKICYAPPSKPARLIWVEGEKSKELHALKKSLEKLLLEKISFSAERREYNPHVTLGRIKLWEFRKIEPEERPEIEEYLSLKFEVNSIEIMESRLKRGGMEYTILESIPLLKE